MKYDPEHVLYKLCEIHPTMLVYKQVASTFFVS